MYEFLWLQQQLSLQYDIIYSHYRVTFGNKVFCGSGTLQCPYRTGPVTRAANSSFSPQVLNEMTDLLSSSRNYENYRLTYSKSTGFKIPILGVHLKDLITVNEAMTDYLDNDKINVQKLQALYNHINELIQLQQNPPLLDANKDLVHLLTVSTVFIFWSLHA